MDGGADVDGGVRVAADLGGRPRGLGVTTALEDEDAAVVSGSRTLDGLPRFFGGAEEDERVVSTLAADLGGRPRRFFGSFEKLTL